MHLTYIPLPLRSANASDASDACLFVGDFVGSALNEHCYRIGELPYDAVCFANLWEYHGQVQNGGHAFFVFNVGEEVDRWHRAIDLLGRMDLPAYRSILGDTLVHARHHEERIYDLLETERRMEVIEPFYPFDDRFGDLEEERPLKDRMAGWLLHQPWLRIVDDPVFDRGWVRDRVPAHPEAAARRAARDRRGVAENRGALLALIRRFLDR